MSGWLVQLLNGPIAILIDAVSFLASALAVIGIRKQEPPPRPAEEREGVRKEIVEGARAILHHPMLRATAAAHAIAGFSFRMFGAVFLLYAIDELGFKPGVLGLVWAVGGVDLARRRDVRRARGSAARPRPGDDARPGRHGRRDAALPRGARRLV